LHARPRDLDEFARSKDFSIYLNPKRPKVRFGRDPSHPTVHFWNLASAHVASERARMASINLRPSGFRVNDHDGPPAPRSHRILGPSNLPAFEQLTSPTRPGLTVTEFRNLFSRCGNCGLVKMCDVLGSHTCREVIDLTTDEE
jgi:hypothetical protein